MLEQMRSNSKSWLIYFIFGAIIVVFTINFGPGFDQLSSQGCSTQQKNAIAVVNGESIPRRMFLFQHESRTQNIPANILQQMDFKGQMLKQKVDRVLMAQLAVQYGLKVSQEEIDKDIVSNPAFQNRKEMYDATNFRRFVSRYYGMTTSQYKESVEQKLLANKMRTLIQSGVVVSDQEVKEDYNLQNDKVRLVYAELDASSAQLKNDFTAKEVADFIQKSNKELEKYFQSHLSEFVTKRQVRARQIVFHVKDWKNKKEVAKRKQELAKLRKELEEKPQKFEENAKKHSDDSSKEKGGDIGFVLRNDLDIAPARAIFGLKTPLQISNIVKTSKGFALYQMVENKGSKKQTLKEKSVQETIAKKLLAQKMLLKMAENRAKKWIAKLQKNESLAKLVAPFVKDKDNKGKETLYTGKLFSQKQIEEFVKNNATQLTAYFEKNKSLFLKQEKKVRARHILFKVGAKDKNAKQRKADLEKLRQELLKAPQKFEEYAKKHSEGPSKVRGGDLGFFGFKSMVRPFSVAAFALKKANDVSEIVKTNFGYHIIQLVAIQPKSYLAITDKKVQANIAKTLLFASLKKKNDPFYGHIKSDKTSLFTKDSSYISGIGENADLVKLAFAMKKANDVHPQPFVSNNKVYVVQLKEHKQPNAKKFEKEKKELKKRALTKKQNDVLEALLTSLREKASITKDEKYFAKNVQNLLKNLPANFKIN